jgi:hypothetical protein
MEILIKHPFISKKTGHNWTGTNMTTERYTEFEQKLKGAIKNGHLNEIKSFLDDKKRLSIEVRIYGKANRIKLLDIHDAVVQIINKITDMAFPRELHKPSPQTKDRHFWRITGEKFIDNNERTWIGITEL